VPSDALESALRALGHRDRSAREIERRLTERGFAPEEREQALEALRRTGVVDDERFARNRAESLAARGAGDELIRHDLVRAGIERDVVDEAVALLEPEARRASRIVERRGAGPKTARYLASKGFSRDVVAAAVASDEGRELG
jgi:regulatory protein